MVTVDPGGTQQVLTGISCSMNHPPEPGCHGFAAATVTRPAAGGGGNQVFAAAVESRWDEALGALVPHYKVTGGQWTKGTIVTRNVQLMPGDEIYIRTGATSTSVVGKPNQVQAQVVLSVD